MRLLSFFLFSIVFFTYSEGQTIENPSFEKSDVLSFHITKVEITNDTTYVLCLYHAEDNSWASISPNTYLRDSKSHKTFPLQRCEGLPYSPEKRRFSQNENCELLFCFPSIAGIEQFDFIESDSERGFNIYGVCMNKRFKISYTDEELKHISEMISTYTTDDIQKTVVLKDYASSLNNLISYNLSKGNYTEAIRLGKTEVEIKETIFGKETPIYLESLENLVDYYAKEGNYGEAIRLGTDEVNIIKEFWGTKATSYVNSLEKLSNYYKRIGNFDEAIRLQQEVTNIKKALGDNQIDYAYSLANLAISYSEIANYNEAIKLGTEAIEIMKKILGIGNHDYAVYLSILADFYSEIGNYRDAIQHGKEAIDIIKKVDGANNPNYVNLLEKVAYYNSELANYDEAIRLRTEAIEVRKTIHEKEDVDYAWSLNMLAHYYAELGSFDEAIRLGAEGAEILKMLVGTHHPDYSTSIANLANYYSDSGNYNEAIRLGKEATEIIKEVDGADHLNYITSLSNLAFFYFEAGDFIEAVRLKTEATDIIKEVDGSDHLNYATSLSRLGDYYTCLGNYHKALRIGLEANELLKKNVGTEHHEYASSLSNLARVYSKLGNFTKAISLESQSMEIIKRLYVTDYLAYANSLNNLAGYYQDIGNYAETIKLLTDAKGIYERVSGTGSLNYAISLNNLADYNSKVGNYSEAIRLGIEAMNLYKKQLGTDHPLYIQALSNLVSYNSEIGNYSEAIRLGIEAMEIYKRMRRTEHPDYAALLGNLAIPYSEIGNYSEAIKLGTEAMEVRKKVLGIDHPDYARSLNGLSVYYSEIGNYYEAIRLETEAIEVRKNALGIEHPLYATSLVNLAWYYYEFGNYSEAIRLGTEAMEILKKIVGTNHPYYTTLLIHLSNYYNNLGNYFEAFNCLQHCMTNSQSFILKNFTEFSSRIQNNMWTNMYAYRFNTILPNIVTIYQTKQSVSELYDKTCLFASGVLLNTGMEIRKLILESDDSVIIDKYNALSSNINLYNKLLEKPIKERFMNADSLNRVIERQEMVLARESKAYGDYTHNLTINWKDVQRKLDDDDIAVEFLDFPVLNSDSIMYVALTLKKGYDSPHMVTLFEKRQLNAIHENVYYTQTDVSDIIWKPLEEELKGVRNIYFAPSGELHRIGIEYLPIGKTENICDVYTLHRLSSTRQLAVFQDETKGKNTILYGGINYDEKSNTVPVSSSTTKEPKLRSAFTYRANIDSLSLRNSYDYLEGSKKEADLIAEDMKLHSVPYNYYSGTDATEESFKMLDGTRPKMMHIATHGFYLTEIEAEKTQFARSGLGLLTDVDQWENQYFEHKSMTRSGLLFSGCNHIIQHEQIPDGEEDGILTAQEISTLDLRGLDLVVLSACQTGLGDIVSGEGVFGLQRGFKKAGARTIIMSLWNVNDESTMKMMTSFYHHYLEGMPKDKAFRTAQDELRKDSSTQQERPDWAAFIMLDGI